MVQLTREKRFEKINGLLSRMQIEANKISWLPHDKDAKLISEAKKALFKELKSGSVEPRYVGLRGSAWYAPALAKKVEPRDVDFILFLKKPEPNLSKAIEFQHVRKWSGDLLLAFDERHLEPSNKNFSDLLALLYASKPLVENVKQLTEFNKTRRELIEKMRAKLADASDERLKEIHLQLIKQMKQRLGRYRLQKMQDCSD